MDIHSNRKKALFSKLYGNVHNSATRPCTDPDFVVCIEHEHGVPPMQRLIETKHDVDDARRKAAHFPPAYGKVLFITEDKGRMVRITDTGNLAEVITFSETGSFLQLLRETRPNCG